MQRRKFVIGMGSLAAGGTVAIGSGAFSSVEADRHVAVEVAGDADAFLGLEPGDENGDYAQVTDGTLALNFDEDDAVSGDGFNQNATTAISDVFKVRNQGTQNVEVGIGLVDEDEDNYPGDITATDHSSNDNLPNVVMLTEGNPDEGAAFILDIGDDDEIGVAEDPPVLEPGQATEVHAAFYEDELGIIDGLEDVNFEIEIVAEASD